MTSAAYLCRESERQRYSQKHQATKRIDDMLSKSPSCPKRKISICF